MKTETWRKFYTPCDEHITTEVPRYGIECAKCRSLTHDALATWARIQASKKAPAPKYEGKWWYEQPDRKGLSEIQRWQHRYADFMAAANSGRVTS